MPVEEAAAVLRAKTSKTRQQIQRCVGRSKDIEPVLGEWRRQRSCHCTRVYGNADCLWMGTAELDRGSAYELVQCRFGRAVAVPSVVAPKRPDRDHRVERAAMNSRGAR